MPAGYAGGRIDPADLALVAPRRPAGGAVFELHAHASERSLDSGARAAVLAAQAAARGLNGTSAGSYSVANALDCIIGEAVFAESGVSGEIARRFINVRLKSVKSVISVRSCGRVPVLTMIKARINIPILEIPGCGRGGCCGGAHAKRSGHQAERNWFAEFGHKGSPVSVHNADGAINYSSRFCVAVLRVLR